MARYRIEHISDKRFFHIEFNHPNDPILARTCQKYGWSLDECDIILLQETTDQSEPLTTRK